MSCFPGAGLKSRGSLWHYNSSTLCFARLQNVDIFIQCIFKWALTSRADTSDSQITVISAGTVVIPWIGQARS